MNYVSKLTSVLSEDLPGWNMARLKFLARFVSSLLKLSTALASPSLLWLPGPGVKSTSNYRRIQRFMADFAFDFITKSIDFEDLEITIRKTHADLKTLRHATSLQRQLTVLQRELEIASRIQLSSLPPSGAAFSERRDFDLYAAMIPAQEVGGDFYDYFLIDEHRLGVALGDVSGKGVGAALFMAITRTMLRATALQGLAPATCVRHINRVLHPESMAQMFVTLVYAVLDTQTGALTYCNAGHNPPA